MNQTWTRLGAWALLLGGALASAGYLAVGLLVHGDQQAQLLNPLWTPLQSVAIVGDLIAVLGLPVALAAQFGRFRALTAVGVFGTYAALTMLNVADGVVEAYVEPYLAVHGGVPTQPPVGWDVFETVALLPMLVGLVCLGLAVILERRFPWPAGAMLIVSPVVALLGLPTPFALISDYLAFGALGIIAVQVIRGRVRSGEGVPAARRSAPVTEGSVV
jgi:hypothetical protein